MKWWKIALLGVAVVVLGVAALVGRALWLAANAKPGGAVDFAAQMEQLSRDAQKDDARGGDGYAKLLEATAGLSKLRSEFEAGAKGAATRSPADWPQGFGWPTDFSMLRAAQVDEKAAGPTRELLARVLASRVPALLEETAKSKPGVRVFQRRSVLILEELPYLSSTRELARMNMARMHEAHAAGNGEGLVRAFEDGLAMGRVLAYQTTLIERLVSMAIIAGTEEELRNELVEKPMDGRTLRELLAAMDRQRLLPPVEMAFECERLACMDTIQWTHTDDGDGDGRLILSSMAKVQGVSGPGTTARSSIFTDAFVATVAPSKKQTTASANEIYERIKAMSRLPPAKRDTGSVDAAVDALPRTQVVLKTILPALGRATRAADQAECGSAGTRLMLAIEIYRAEHGAYPGTLAALVPGVLTELPKDLWASDGMFVYKNRDPAKEGGYLLYSVGADGSDDGGKPHPTNATIAVSGSSEGGGFDYIYNAPRR